MTKILLRLSSQALINEYETETIMSLYWLEQTMAVMPLVLWVYFGVGIPYALVCLPRSEWHKRVSVVALAFALGPALLTMWMLILGVIGGALETALLRFDLTFGGTIVIALIGYGLLWRKAQTPSAKVETEQPMPLAFDERLLIDLIVLAVLVRWVVTSYWSFTAYDALWVYGYQGRLYHLLGYIPQDIGYYPQFMSLQYTFFQLLSEGFDDHAARAVIPFLHVGSILATYMLGSRLFTRRVGIIAAAIWTFYPHVAQWAHIGDLEIPLTFTLTLTMTFFLQAWSQETTRLRRHYALLAGICFGIAMWTKPTAGAFIYGVVLLVVIEFLRMRGNWRAWYPRFEVAAITGLACIPMGAVWYLRNIALGLPPLVFPPDVWLTLATRSGDLLSFPILALLLAIAYKASKGDIKHGWVMLIGVLLLLAGTMPSSPLISEALGAVRRDPPMSYFTPLELVLTISGAILIAWTWRERLIKRAGSTLSSVGWAYLLILPYFVTYFWSYSYHARLSFAIVPVMLLPSAVILARWLPSIRLRQWHGITKTGFASLLIALALPGILTPITGVSEYSDYLWTNRYPDDFSKTKAYNPGVALAAEYLWGYEAYYDEVPVVVAPGEQRLPFFMPYATIISDTVPTTYEELEGITHYIYGTQARWRYEDEGIEPLDNRIVASLGREHLFSQVLRFRGGIFTYDIYELFLDAEYELYELDLFEDEVIYGGVIEHLEDRASNTQLVGNTIHYDVFFRVLAPIEENYHLRVDLVNIETDTIYETWELTSHPNEHGYYNSELWQVGEVVRFSDTILVNITDLPTGFEAYRLGINFVNSETGEILPVTLNGEPVDRYTVFARFSVGQ
ncbi:MAG: glycosyltransferase family 39 protein [Chloroflexota bacterium]